MPSRLGSLGSMSPTKCARILFFVNTVSGDNQAAAFVGHSSVKVAKHPVKCFLNSCLIANNNSIVNVINNAVIWPLIAFAGSARRLATAKSPKTHAISRNKMAVLPVSEAVLIAKIANKLLI